MPRKECLIDRTFGKLTVIEQAKSIMSVGGRPRTTYSCKCDCGRRCICLAQNLKSGKKTSCGCDTSERRSATHTTHGHAKQNARSPTYETWASMLNRCVPGTSSSKYHGDLGIRVCRRWHSFEKFLADMGERKMGWSIERIRVKGNYEPGNCRWIKRGHQTWNLRKTRLVSVRGRSVPCNVAARMAGVSWPCMMHCFVRFGEAHAYKAAMQYKKMGFKKWMKLVHSGEIERFAKVMGW